MGLLSSLRDLGFDSDGIEVFSKKKETIEKNGSETPREIREEDFLLGKKTVCPCCDENFPTLTVRAGKVKSIGQDDDLRPLYENIDPVKYDAIVCPKCGYAALSRFFAITMPTQRKKIREEITPKFKGMQCGENAYSYDEAITRYKMVLLCDIVGMGKNSRKAYTCLKLAWVIRGKLEKEGSSLDTFVKKELEEEEQDCLKKAYEGFSMAFTSESFPMCGMDEISLSYLMATLAFKLGEYRQSMQYLSTLLGNGSVSPRIKNKAIDLKEKIREQIKSE